MREKLIELLQNSPTDAMGNHGVGALADYLIANGVTVPPITAGSKVYALYVHYDAKRGYYYSKTRHYKHQIVTNKNLEVAKQYNVEIREKNATKQDILLLGRLVFLTREEAEQALNGVPNDEGEIDFDYEAEV